jgi:hypothetical protein
MPAAPARGLLVLMVLLIVRVRPNAITCVPEQPGPLGPQVSNATLTSLWRDRTGFIHPNRSKRYPACDGAQLAGAADRFIEFVRSATGRATLPPLYPTRGGDGPPGNTSALILMVMEGGAALRRPTLNVICGLKRLRLLERTVVVALDRESNALAASVGAFTIHDPEFNRLIVRIGKRTKVPVKNRIAKLVAALALLEQGQTVLVSDLDTVWADSPLDYLEGTGADFVGAGDICWAEMNTGFLYYRPTAAVLTLLRTALGYVKTPVEMETDNDQYLLNCAWPYVAQTHGLRYADHIADYRDFLYFVLVCIFGVRFWVWRGYL